MTEPDEDLSLAIGDWAFRELAFVPSESLSLAYSQPAEGNIFQHLCKNPESRRIWKFVISELKHKEKDDKPAIETKATTLQASDTLDDKIEKLEAEIKKLECSIGELSNLSEISKQKNLHNRRSAIIFRSHSISLDKKSKDFASLRDAINTYLSKSAKSENSNSLLKTTNSIGDQIYDLVKVHGVAAINIQAVKKQKNDIVTRITSLLNYTGPNIIADFLANQILHIKSSICSLHPVEFQEGPAGDTRLTSTTELYLEKFMTGLREKHVTGFIDICDKTNTLKRGEIEIKLWISKLKNNNKEKSSSDLYVELKSMEAKLVNLKAQQSYITKIIADHDIKPESQDILLVDALNATEQEVEAKQKEILLTMATNEKLMEVIRHENSKVLNFEDTIKTKAVSLDIAIQHLQSGLSSESHILKSLNFESFLPREYATLRIISDVLIQPLSAIKFHMNVPQFAPAEKLLHVSRSVKLQNKLLENRKKEMKELLPKLRQLSSLQKATNEAFTKEMVQADEKITQKTLPYLEKHSKGLKGNASVCKKLEKALSNFEKQPAFARHRKNKLSRIAELEMAAYAQEFRQTFLGAKALEK